MSRPSRRSCLRPCSTLGPQGLKRQLQVIPCSYPPSHRLVTICHTATGTLGLPPCSWVRAGRKTSLPQSCAGVSRECGRHHMCRGGTLRRACAAKSVSGTRAKIVSARRSCTVLYYGLPCIHASVQYICIQVCISHLRPSEAPKEGGRGLNGV